MGGGGGIFLYSCYILTFLYSNESQINKFEFDLKNMSCKLFPQPCDFPHIVGEEDKEKIQEKLIHIGFLMT